MDEANRPILRTSINPIESWISVIAIVIIIVIVRSFYTVPPEMWEDTVEKWDAAVVIATEGNAQALLRDEHHSSRWGVVLPVAALNAIGSPALLNYYLAPLIAYALMFFIMGYWLARCSQSMALGLACCVFLFYEPQFFNASSHMLSYVFGASSVVASIWCIDRYLTSRRVVLLILAAVCAFLAYAAKETYVFFYPGLFLLLWIRGSLRISMVFAGLLLLLWLLETLAFNAIQPDLILGRVEFLLSGGKHLDSIDKKYPDGVAFWDMVSRRWVDLDVYAKIVAAISAIYLLARFLARDFLEMDTPSLGVALCAVSYALLVSATPKQFHPLQPLQPLFTKYLTVLMPFFAYLVGHAVIYLVKKIPARWGKRVVFGMLAAAITMVALDVLGKPLFKYKRGTNTYPQHNAFVWRYGDVKSQFENGAGVCGRNRNNRKMARTFFNTYVYPPVRDSEMFYQEVTLENGLVKPILRHVRSKGTPVNGYIRAREMAPIDSLAECNFRGQ